MSKTLSIPITVSEETLSEIATLVIFAMLPEDNLPQQVYLDQILRKLYGDRYMEAVHKIEDEYKVKLDRVLP
jgi:uncharacterized protein YjgD (DUF1641 family)